MRAAEGVAPRRQAVMLLVILAVATLASVVPASEAARLRVAQTLRYDG